MTTDPTDKLYHELLMDACAAHLIGDWKSVVFAEVVNGQTVETDMPYTAEKSLCRA